MGSEPESSAPIHILMVSFPGQGHINPLLRLAKRLASKGLFITFTTPQNAGKELQNASHVITDKPIPIGDGFLRFDFFDDGWEESDPRRKDLSEYLVQLELVGKQAISHMIHKYKENSHDIKPVSCVINNAFVPWVCDVAAEFSLPCSVLWVQSCSVFSVYYHFSHKLVPFPSDSNPHIDVQLPSLPVLKHDEIPSFLHSYSPYHFIGELILEQIKRLSVPFCVLMDTFEELESEYIKYMSKFCNIRSVGPLFKNPQILEDENVIRGDMFEKAEDCIEWLNSREKESVVYISFGSIVHLPQEQVEEIAYALLDSSVSFLWVLKPPHKSLGLQSHVLPECFLDKTMQRGKVVQWSPQEEVLPHPSISCFVTHCGWNSSVEALTCGVPVLTFPAWGDQITNAKFLVDVFEVGIKLGSGQDQYKLITRHEVNKCLEEAMFGPRSQELKNNALRWKAAAEAAIADGGSSSRNLEAFVEDVKRMACGGASVNVNRKDEDNYVLIQE